MGEYHRATRPGQWSRSWVAVIALTVALAGAGCNDDAMPARAGAPSAGSTSPTTAASGAVLVGAGDIGLCGKDADEATAALLDRIPGTVFTAGDNAYEDGSAKDFSSCYQPSWGKQRDRTRPAAGNHEYHTHGAEAYFQYFGSAAGDPSKGYYSYDLGGWHVVVLNSNCDDVGGCAADSAQARWLREDLAAHPAKCALAYWHHAYFTSGDHHEPAEFMRPLVDELSDGGVDVVVAAHNHNYERFAPQTPDRVPAENGLRAFVVGTGGASLNGFGKPQPNSEAREAKTYGLLKLTLDQGTYTWEFVPVPDEKFTDVGKGTCH
ncbi:calcineurin-like phosphoesterase family protein [Kribbella amoyensis]|uniref:Calcineurin-like phosphoesterase family protein n=1 Tax=Kribbella amoyensis TaxID=996641 RepID=A0A561C0Q6_9ACTN|nr:metallophosphoesterase [Kribbella amoyensis]TWD84753.1 calcineurin-like phosphoesterase family protein [Kribbella amoyensis]